MSSYIKITLTRIPDDSTYYEIMRDYEKVQVFIAVKASISDNMLKFSSSGRKYAFELDKWDVQMSTTN